MRQPLTPQHVAFYALVTSSLKAADTLSVSVIGKDNLTEGDMHGLIYLIGLIVVILFILSLFGLR